MTTSPDTLARIVAEMRAGTLVCLNGADDRALADRLEKLSAASVQVTAFRELVEACEQEFDVEDRDENGELVFPDEDKVAYPEDTCHITFGHIRRARAALRLSPQGESHGR